MFLLRCFLAKLGFAEKSRSRGLRKSSDYYDNVTDYLALQNLVILRNRNGHASQDPNYSDSILFNFPLWGNNTDYKQKKQL